METTSKHYKNVKRHAVSLELLVIKIECVTTVLNSKHHHVEPGPPDPQSFVPAASALLLRAVVKVNKLI